MALPIADVLGWYAENARPLPWRAPSVTPWGVLVSEIMLQQTPAARVVPVWQAWTQRWPTAAALAAESVGEVVRMWGSLGYPRRALRLRESAVAIVALHGGEVPTELADLLALPGVGGYTARAVASFGFGQCHAVVDTNVRRVLSRAVRGLPNSGPATIVSDLALAEPVLPESATVAPTFAAAIMELGALVCTARAPRCQLCPISSHCAWQLAGRPMLAKPARPPQRFTGTDRQARGRLLAVLRDSQHPVPPADLDTAWPDPVQRGRALASLLADGLAVRHGDRYALP